MPSTAGAAAIGAVVHLPATAIEEGQSLSLTSGEWRVASGVLAGTAYRLPPTGLVAPARG
ncbi:hypothetical protein RB199_06355 [Streptomyces libani]